MCKNKIKEINNNQICIINQNKSNKSIKSKISPNINKLLEDGLNINNINNKNKIKMCLKGGRKSIKQFPQISTKKIDCRISPRDSAISFASQQVRHVKLCNENTCKYTWCGVIKKLIEHYKICSVNKLNNGCYKCDSLRVLLLRAQGKFIAPPKRENINISQNQNQNQPIRQQNEMGIVHINIPAEVAV